MPLFMDLHKLPPGVTPEDLALAHMQDMELQWKYGVKYLRYWFNQDSCKAFCLVEAPSVEAAVAVHREGHGLVADEIIEVETGLTEKLLGTVEEAPAWTPASSGPPPAENAFRTILFTDMEGSTALTQRLGDAGMMELLHRHDAIIREALSALAGREVKHTGDGIMACFESVGRAVECSIAMQRGFASHNQSQADLPIRVRIGLSAGEPVEEHRDLYGAAVQMAARICSLAEPERILVSNVIRELAVGKPFVFENRGEVTLRGFTEPVRLHEVRWQEEAS